MHRALAAVLAFSAVAGDESIFAWHITDPHVDPFYTAGAPTSGCVCRSHTKCPARPGSTSCEASVDHGAAAAGLFGDAEANCQSPELLWTSSLKYAANAKPDTDIPVVLFTGDHCAYMLCTPCNNSAHGLEPGSSREGTRTCLRDTFNALKSTFPKSLILPALGNHDTVVLEYEPGKSDGAFASTELMAWLYEEMAALWAKSEVIGCDDDGDFADIDFACATANATITRAGYYSTRLKFDTVNVTVLGLNTNYWALKTNPALRNTTGAAHELGEEQFDWAKKQLDAAETRGDQVMVVGHIPPYEGMWTPGNYRRWATMLEPYMRKGMQLNHFFGHKHTDEWMLVRACDAEGPECAGEPLGLMVTSPSVSFSFPAANPAVRLLEFGAHAFELKDMLTYSSDLHAANDAGEAVWELEYSFAKEYGFSQGISPTAMASLVERMLPEDSVEWHKYRGAENGTFFCRGWLADQGGADTHCAQNCQGDCKSEWLRVLNGTGTAATMVV